MYKKRMTSVYFPNFLSMTDGTEFDRRKTAVKCVIKHAVTERFYKYKKI